jgi:hypothetical protein
MRRNASLEHLATRIMAVDDTFVDERAVGQHIYDAAGLDANHITQCIEDMLDTEKSR